MKKFLSGMTLSLRSTVASLCLASCVACMAGCTPQQQATTLQVVTAVNAKLPTVVAAADTVAATIAALAPADAALIAVCDGGFDVAARTLQALTTSYIASPNASTLAQIQTAINTLETQINTATLNAVGIKNVTNQQLALAALKGLLTVVTVIFALISPTETVAQLVTLRKQHGIQLARVRPYMDDGMLQAAARDSGVSVDKSFRQAEAFGF